MGSWTAADGRRFFQQLLQCEFLVAQSRLAGFGLPANLAAFLLYFVYQLT